MRTWVVTKVSRLKAVLSWTITIWAMTRSMSELRQRTRRNARQSTRVRARQKINELITIWVSSIIKTPLLDSLTSEAKLIQVTRIATKYTNKSFISWLGGFFSHFSLRVEGGLGGSFPHFFVVVGARNKLRSTPLTLILTSLKTNTQFLCGFCDTLLNSTQIILNHFLAQSSFLKTYSQIGNLLLKLGILFGSMKNLTLERTTQFTLRG
jgi:hypothetical protein